MDRMAEKYSVGALLYSPALNNKVADAVIGENTGNPIRWPCAWRIRFPTAPFRWRRSRCS